MLAWLECYWLQHRLLRNLCWLGLNMANSRKMIVIFAVLLTMLFFLFLLHNILAFFNVIYTLIVILRTRVFATLIMGFKVSFHSIFNSLTHKRVWNCPFNISYLVGTMLIIVGVLFKKTSRFNFRLIMKPSILLFAAGTKIVISLW